MSLLAWLILVPCALSVLVTLGLCRSAGQADEWIEQAADALRTPTPHLALRHSPSARSTCALHD